MVVDLFETGNSCLTVYLALRRMQDMLVLYVNLELNGTPRYFVSLVQAIFSLKILMGAYCGLVDASAWNRV
jgi:hypothetical protein